MALFLQKSSSKVYYSVSRRDRILVVFRDLENLVRKRKIRISQCDAAIQGQLWAIFGRMLYLNQAKMALFLHKSSSKVYYSASRRDRILVIFRDLENLMRKRKIRISQCDAAVQGQLWAISGRKLYLNQAKMALFLQKSSSKVHYSASRGDKILVIFRDLENLVRKRKI